MNFDDALVDDLNLLISGLESETRDFERVNHIVNEFTLEACDRVSERTVSDNSPPALNVKFKSEYFRGAKTYREIHPFLSSLYINAYNEGRRDLCQKIFRAMELIEENHLGYRKY